ncbi:MAG: 50S ribosomal protein L9 [Parachlamydiaceae bacterium]|nr:50S ribosomal protein L9 [Parachlamydiaceae bacterium]
MANELLLLEDVDVLGRKGEIVKVKPGYARNFLLPQGLAVKASKHTLGRQQRLQEERQQLALQHKAESEQLANQLSGITLTKIVKVDHDNNMYGSVSVADIAHLVLDYAKIDLDKKAILLKHPIKEIGVHEINLKLKEGVTTSFHLKVMSEEGYRQSLEEKSAEKSE